MMNGFLTKSGDDSTNKIKEGKGLFINSFKLYPKNIKYFFLCVCCQKGRERSSLAYQDAHTCVYAIIVVDIQRDEDKKFINISCG